MKYYVELAGRELGIEVLRTQHGTIVRPADQGESAPSTVVDFEAVHAHVDTGEGLYSLIANGKSYQLYVQHTEEGYKLTVSRFRFDLNVLSEREWRLKKVAPRQTAHSGQVSLKAPMPGLVKSVLASEGDTVTKGQRVVVLEAMKMENDIASPADGRVLKVSVQPGSIVEGGKVLVIIEA